MSLEWNKAFFEDLTHPLQVVRMQFEAHYASLPVDKGGETQSQVAEPAAASHQDDNTMVRLSAFSAVARLTFY